MYLLLQHFYISELTERRAQNQHRPIAMLLHFWLSVYRCSPVSGPHSRTLRSQFKWPPYSSVLGPETHGSLRSLVGVYSHVKNRSLCFCELCALLCMFVVVSVYSHCKVRVRHIWFSGSDKRFVSNCEVGSPPGCLRNPLSFKDPAQTSDWRTFCWAGFRHKPDLSGL